MYPSENDRLIIASGDEMIGWTTNRAGFKPILWFRDSHIFFHLNQQGIVMVGKKISEREHDICCIKFLNERIEKQIDTLWRKLAKLVLLSVTSDFFLNRDQQFSLS